MLGYGKQVGDMKVESYDCDYPEAGYAGKQEGKTNMYKERQDKIVDKEAKDLKSKAYKGRYD